MATAAFYLEIFQRLFPWKEYSSIVVVQSPIRVLLFATPWTVTRQVSLSLTISQSLPELMSIALVMPSSHLILWCPLLLLPSVFPSIRKFFSESAVHIRWPQYWNFSFNISPSNKYSGLISLKINWFDLLTVQGTQKHNCLKASILWCSAFFMVQLSQPYMTYRTLNIWKFLLIL